LLEAFFKPSSVAVIGASRKPGKVGHEVTANILKSGFSGRLFPINPQASKVLGLRCYPSILNVPEDVDLGVIAVPANTVPEVTEQCGEKGVGALIIISAGFREIGPDGMTLEAQVVDVCRKHRMRLLGPNCLGLIDVYTPLNASFAKGMPLRGNIAFISQSGALATSILSWSVGEGVGFSHVVSLGNRADVDEIDFMEAIVDDPKTKVILVYIESVGDGGKFRKLAPLITRKKPVLIVKAGITEAGARAVSSHTGSIAGSNVAYETAFKQAGFIHVSSVEELFYLAKAFSTQPIPEGPNVAIVTNAGGPSILATDSCEKYGVKLASFSTELVQRLRERLPPAAGYYNPVDLLGDAPAERYRFALRKLLGFKDVHSVIVILTPQAMTEPMKTAQYIAELQKEYPLKPILTAFLGGGDVREGVKTLHEAGIPNYIFPERAAYTLGQMMAYSRFLETPLPHPAERLPVDEGSVREIIDVARKEGRINLIGVEAMKILKAYGIPVVPSRIARTPDEAAQFADSMGYPVVVKVYSPQILHKTDIGGVRLGLSSSQEVREAFEAVISNAGRFMPQAMVFGAEVYRMAPIGKEMIIGVHRDPQFGPLIVFGLGGIYVNILKDVSFRFAPLTPKEALDMVSETQAYTLLRGVRGEASSDVESILDTLQKVSQLVTDFKEIVEMDINPLFVYERGKGCLAIDVKITVV